METFIQLVVNGLGKGAVYALLALGFVMIFKATEVVNFALGSLVLFGGYLVYVLRDVIGWYGAAAVGIVGAALVGLLHRAALRGRPRRRPELAGPADDRRRRHHHRGDRAAGRGGHPVHRRPLRRPPDPHRHCRDLPDAGHRAGRRRWC